MTENRNLFDTSEGPFFTFFKARDTAWAVRNGGLLNSRDEKEMEVRGWEEKERSTRRPVVSEAKVVWAKMREREGGAGGGERERGRGGW